MGSKSFFELYFIQSMQAYSNKAANTNKRQVITHKDIEVIDSDSGLVLVIFRKIFIKTKNSVTNKVILPGIISGGIMKLT